MIQQEKISPSATENCALCGANLENGDCASIEQSGSSAESSGRVCKKCFEKIYSAKNEHGEDAIAAKQPMDEKFDHTVKYSSEYYEQYIQSFVPNQKRRLGYRFFKRTFDILLSLFGLIVASPIMLLVAIAVKLDSKMFHHKHVIVHS